MTLAFLQAGDLLRTDRLCSEEVCVRKHSTPLFFRQRVRSSQHGWTASILVN